ncbi:MAG: biopolymer transporter ExbD [Myxococcales bacterium]|nr:biopolymer transporter ExbD [Myxococcales bacterium]MCB9567427.1 biopolymer transporter ExbD [Myxococcales bacterium]MCB9700702.1 biopolymer transporter ExbD [Myxococcales bacterium]
MAADTNADDDDGINSINVTPLVDVMLVLLVIFMATTTTIQDSEAMRVDKPDAKTGTKLEPNPHQILLMCTKEGSYAIDRIKVDGETDDKRDQVIKDAIAAKLKEDQDLQGVIQCDEAAQVGAMVHLIDLLRDSGVKKYAIATEKPKPQEGV